MKFLSTPMILALLIVASARADDAKPDAESQNPVRLETIVSLATGPEGETPDQAKERAVKFDAEIDRLLEVLSEGGGTELIPPVRMSGLDVIKATESVNGGYVHVTAGQKVKTVQNSIVVLEPDGAIESVEHSIVILSSTGKLTNVQNSIVLVRYAIDVRQAEASVILSGCDAALDWLNKCVCGVRERIQLSYPYREQDTLFVNSNVAPTQLSDNSRVVQVKGLNLTTAFDRSLGTDVEVTAVDAGLALLRTKDGKGEYVVRRGQPVLDPDGQPVAPLAGWQLEYSAAWNQLAVFENNGRRAALRAVPHDAGEAAQRTAPVRNSSGNGEKPADGVRRNHVEAKTDPVRVETLIRLATGPEGETPDEAQARAARFDREIARLLALLSHGSKRDIKPPVKMSGLPVVKAATTVNGGYVHIKRGQTVKSALNSIVVLDEKGSIGSAKNCIVIATSDMYEASVQDSVVLARYEAVLYAYDSVVLCGLDLFFIHATRCICGAGRRVGTELGIKDFLIVNTPKISALSSDNPRTVQIAGLELAARQDDSFKNVVEVTFATQSPQKFALLRLKDGKGEYVARLGRPVLDPDGRPVAALDGWRLEQISNAGYVVFAKPGRYAELRAEKRTSP